MRLRPLLAVLLTCLLAWSGLVAWRLDERPDTVVARSGTAELALPLAWPAQGQAALEVAGWDEAGAGDGPGVTGLGSHGNGRPTPIASLAKIMTAYLVLRDHPLADGERGFTVTIQEGDVDDYLRRRDSDQSVVAVQAGEVLDQRQLLEALLVPSGNNIAALLAVHEAGSVARFVDAMNAQARALGMRDTTYTDPSGFDAATVSTAADQLILVRAAMQFPAFRQVVALRTVRLPVAGQVHNTNPLLGRPGVLGVKTGSHDAAGGCLAFAVRAEVGGREITLTGVVLGQHGPRLLETAGAAAWELARSALAELADRAASGELAGQR